DSKLRERLAQVTTEAAMKSIDTKTGIQTWSGIGEFLENALLNTDNVSLKMAGLSILRNVSTLFGPDSESPLSLMRACLGYSNPECVQSSTEWLNAFLKSADVEEALHNQSADVSLLIPLIIQRAEERLINAEKDNESHLIGCLVELVCEHPNLTR
ncbi:hypothetical protein PENTCL1PPCAC_4826, partial [Pristionchus entomophagus]